MPVQLGAVYEERTTESATGEAEKIWPVLERMALEVQGFPPLCLFADFVISLIRP